MKISVTQEHIDNGKLCNCYYCPVALAIISAAGTPVRVYGVLAVINEHRVMLPRKAADFIGDFDNLRDVKPFEFELDIPV